MKQKTRKTPTIQNERTASKASRGQTKEPRWVSVSMVVLDKPEPIPAALRKKR